MQELTWMESHLGTLDKAVELANMMYWNMAIEEKEGLYTLRGGDQLIFRSDTREGLEAFLYGFGLAYGVIPGEVFRQTVNLLKPWVE